MMDLKFMPYIDVDPMGFGQKLSPFIMVLLQLKMYQRPELL